VRQVGQMRRTAERALYVWKDKRTRKPLLVYGARQVGKTYLIRAFGTEAFEQVLYVNFEKEISLRTLFEQDYDPHRIVTALGAYFNMSVIPGSTLLVFDEVQEAPGALTALKYFMEEMPELHVMGAGSLLGIAISQKTSFPVGKVEFLRLYPMSFHEFLLAQGEEAMVKAIVQKEIAILDILHDKLVLQLKDYLFVGGMPEVVSTFIQTRVHHEARAVQRDILMAYEQDFSKHAPASVIPKIRTVWNAIVSQLAKENKKFIYGLLRGGARAREFESALDWLEDYGLVYRVRSVSKAHVPLASYASTSSFKLYIHDCGLLGAMGNLSAKALLEKDNLFTEFKGSMTEQFVLQELKANGIDQLFYWSSDTGSAEVDFLFEKEGIPTPLEVKASENLQAKSLRVFADKYPESRCFKTSLSRYREEAWVTNVPLYGVGRIHFPNAI